MIAGFELIQHRYSVILPQLNIIQVQTVGLKQDKFHGIRTPIKPRHQHITANMY